jgi:hypothetical protein
METEPFFDELVDSFRNKINADTAALQVVDEAGEGLNIVAASGFQDKDSIKKLYFGLNFAGLSQQVHKTKKIIIGENVQDSYPHFKETKDSHSVSSIRSWLGVPLINKDGKVIGILTADSSVTGEFSEGDKEIASAFAQAAAIALDLQLKNSRLKKLIYAFVLMPFDTSFDDIYKYGIKKPIENLGITCERVDEIQFNGGILEKVFESINKARFVIADMTGRNPNVFYEVGYCHAIGKEIILCTQSANDIPFDLRGYNHIVYSGKINELEQAIQERVLHFINQEIRHENRT